MTDKDEHVVERKPEDTWFSNPDGSPVNQFFFIQFASYLKDIEKVKVELPDKWLVMDTKEFFDKVEAGLKAFGFVEDTTHD